MATAFHLHFSKLGAAPLFPHTVRQTRALAAAASIAAHPPLGKLRSQMPRRPPTTRQSSARAVAMAAASSKWSETAMLVIDMQNDFILPGGPMNVAGGAAIVPSVVSAVDAARERGIFVTWVVREHDSFGRDVELFRRHLYGDGKGPTTKGSKGAELVDGLVPKEGDYKLAKMRFSAFFDTHLHSVLQSSGIKSLVIVGVQTPNCIRQTVYDAVALNYQPVTVIFDATAAASPEVHYANIQDMKNIGVAAPTLEEWCRTDG